MGLNLFIIGVIVICVSMLWSEGFWSNSLSMINAIFAATLASNYFEPVAKFMDKQFPSLTYFWDFLSLWGLFAIFMLFLRIATDMLSRTKVRFKLPVEQAGRAGFGLATGWVMACFFLFTVHTAPLAQVSFGGAFQETPTSSNFFLSPDRLWLGYLQSRSDSVLSKSDKQVFDPKGEFVLKYGERRHIFEDQPKLKVNR
ncbi:MAG: CvpA family protein [Pirellulaceae bacterium]